MHDVASMNAPFTNQEYYQRLHIPKEHNKPWIGLIIPRNPATFHNYHYWGFCECMQWQYIHRMTYNATWVFEGTTNLTRTRVACCRMVLTTTRPCWQMRHFSFAHWIGLFVALAGLSIANIWLSGRVYYCVRSFVYHSLHCITIYIDLPRHCWSPREVQRARNNGWFG